MPEKIVQLNKKVIKGQLKELVQGGAEETPNELLEAEAEKGIWAARYECNEQHWGCCSGHYKRDQSQGHFLKLPALSGTAVGRAVREGSLSGWVWQTYPFAVWRLYLILLGGSAQP